LDRPLLLDRSVLLACCTVAALLVWVSAGGTVRAVTVIVALTAGTGAALIGWLDITEASLRWTLILGAGTAVTILASLLAIAVRLWYPSTWVVVISLLAALSLGLQLLTRSRTPQSR
jgi:hypothetical protein